MKIEDVLAVETIDSTQGEDWDLVIVDLVVTHSSRNGLGFMRGIHSRESCYGYTAAGTHR